MLINFYFKLKKKFRDFIARKRAETELNLCSTYEDLIGEHFKKAKSNTESYKLHIAKAIQQNETMEDLIRKQAEQAIRRICSERDVKIMRLLQQNEKLLAKKLEFFGDSEGGE